MKSLQTTVSSGATNGRLGCCCWASVSCQTELFPSRRELVFVHCFSLTASIKVRQLSAHLLVSHCSFQLCAECRCTVALMSACRSASAGKPRLSTHTQISNSDILLLRQHGSQIAKLCLFELFYTGLLRNVDPS